MITEAKRSRIVKLMKSSIRGNYLILWNFFFGGLWGILHFLNQLPNSLIPLLFAISWSMSVLPLFLHYPIDWFAPPIYLFWNGLRNILRPVSWMIQGDIDVRLPTTLSENINLLCWVLGTQILAFGLYLIAFYDYHHVRWVRSFAQRFYARFSGNWQIYRLKLLFLFSLPIAVGAYFFILSTAGIESMWELLLGWRSKQKLMEGKFYPFTVLSLFALVILMQMSYCWKERKERVFNWIGLVGLVIYSGAIALFGFRGYVVRVWIMAAGLYHYLVRRLSLKAIVFLLGTVFLFALVSFQIRYAAFKGKITEGKIPDVSITTEVIAQMIEMDLSTRGLDNQLIAFYVFPNHISFQWGKSWLALLTLPIPRAIWKEKPVLTPGGLVRDQFFQSGGSLPLGYLGDLYANFHIPGVLIGYWILGLYHRFLYEWRKKNLQNLSINFLYIVFLTNLTTLEPLSFIHAGIYCLPSILLVKFVETKK
ncbi:MAG: oligosaccharide repeat unit polymerase [Armatimonadetes bacterium]|nr:oligosaccharide repeat unit polymerase [Armatimonadota bacterium]